MLLGAGPDFPLIITADNALVGLARELCRRLLVFLEIIQILQKENPGGLLHIIQLAAAARVFVQDVVDVLEGLFKQGGAPGEIGFKNYSRG